MSLVAWSFAAGRERAVDPSQRHILRPGLEQFLDRRLRNEPVARHPFHDPCGFFIPQIPRAYVREAAARPQQRFIDVIHVGEVRGEDDLAASCPHDAVCDRQKAMQVVIAVAVREQQMIRILDDERVVRA